jgi:hypothetical protein
MKRISFAVQIIAFASVCFCDLRVSADTNAPLDYQEVREIIRANLPGVTDAELDRGALEGLLHSVRGKVRVAGSGTNDAPVETVSKVREISDGIGYFRVTTVDEGLSASIASAVAAMNATNKLTGLIFDLRFSGGENYAAAAALADLFVDVERPLLDGGSGVMKSSVKTNALELPVTLMVNGETMGAAEALAEVMRSTGTGLILGSVTRGAAMTSREFALKNGRRLRIADARVRLGDGAVIAERGVTPDIVVNVSEADERRYVNDPFVNLLKSTGDSVSSLTATNKSPRRVRFTEADLVRARREGVRLDEDSTPQRESDSDTPVIQDPALARAVDLLKGLAVVRRNRF